MDAIAVRHQSLSHFLYEGHLNSYKATLFTYKLKQALQVAPGHKTVLREIEIGKVAADGRCERIDSVSYDP